MNFNDLDIKRLTLNDGDTLVVRVVRGDMTSSRFNSYIEYIRDTLKVYFLTNKIIIIDDSIELTVIEKEKQNESRI